MYNCVLYTNLFLHMYTDPPTMSVPTTLPFTFGTHSEKYFIEHVVCVCVCVCVLYMYNGCFMVVKYSYTHILNRTTAT